MNNINFGRVVLGGLVAGLVLNIGEWLLNAKVLASQMSEFAVKHNFPPEPAGSAIGVAVGLTFVMGIVLVFIGFTGHAFNQAEVKELNNGDSMRVGVYDLKMVNLQQGDGENYSWHRATMAVTKNGEALGTLEPEKRSPVHHRTAQPIARLDLFRARDRSPREGVPLEQQSGTGGTPPGLPGLQVI